MNTIEDRIRAATRAAADLVGDGSVPLLDLSHADSGTSRSRRPLRRGRRVGKPLVPLAAAAAVLMVAVAAIAIPRGLDTGSRRTPSMTSHGGLAPSLPGYLAAVQTVGGTCPIDIRNAATGALTAKISVPLGYSWYAVEGQGPRTFIASKTLNNMGPTTSHFYRIVISDHGKVTSIRKVGAAVPGTVYAFSVTPDDRYVGYVLSMSYGPAGQDGTLKVVLANFSTGRVIASWPVPGSWHIQISIASMSIDAGGNALAIGAYQYHFKVFQGAYNAMKQDLTQWTSVLRPATSGTPINKVPRLLPQAAPLALSPDGATLYEFLQAGRVPSRPQLDRAPVTFDLAAVNATTGTVVEALHTWRAAWPNFNPELALSPAGDYLLIADGVRLARISTATGQYTALPGTVPELAPLVKLNFGQGGNAVNPLAW
jgi:hypothetical protein